MSVCHIIIEFFLSASLEEAKQEDLEICQKREQRETKSKFLKKCCLLFASGSKHSRVE